jgi:threonine dehydrogenase-like Zn-dependent dehydrogenase
MEYSVISAGTERACLLGMENTVDHFPVYPGYSGIGRVTEVGEDGGDLSPGDRVLAYHGRHTLYNTVLRQNATKVQDEALDSLDASLVIIASMGLGGVRKLELEIGESALVMGLGLLGIFSVQFCRLNGAYPVIAADPDPVRRELALRLGADLALDPTEEGFPLRVREATGGRGVNACVEVTGAAAALKEALSCMALCGRVALLGCTRVSDCPIDFYREVHRPGIRLIGAHNFIPRPKFESSPHNWTHQDDCRAILRLLSAGRIRTRPVISRTVSPEDAPSVYRELAESKAFPLGTVFDWREMI